MARSRRSDATDRLAPMPRAITPPARPRPRPDAEIVGGQVSSCCFPENAKREPDLFSLDIRGLNDRPPLLDLGLVVGIERLRRLLFARRKLHADVSEAPLGGGVGEGGRDRGVESGDDRLGRAPGA